MNPFFQVINGGGFPSLIWEVVHFKGNTETKPIGKAKTYAEALALKLKNKHKKDITIELWYKDEIPSLIGDENNMLEIQENLTKYIW